MTALRSVNNPLLRAGLALVLAVTAACGADDDANDDAGIEATSTPIRAVSSPSAVGGSTAATATATSAIADETPAGIAATEEATSTAIVMTPEPAATSNSDSSAASATTSPGMSQLPVNITLTDGAIDPPIMTARAGTISFEITNNGESPHTLEIRTRGMIHVSPEVVPRQSVTWMVQIDAPGEYELYSAIDGVREDGMSATLKVVG